MHRVGRIFIKRIDKTMSADGLLLHPAAFQYFAGITTPEPEILQEIRQYSTQHRMADMAAAQSTTAFLVWLAQLTGVRHYLEIGVFTGYSSTAIAMTLPENGQVVACDISVTHTNAAYHFWHKAGVENKIALYLQPALITLEQLIEQGYENFFDLALIDADKLPTEHYVEACFCLVRQGGVIAIDNVTLGGKILGENQDTPSRTLMNALNHKIVNDTRFHAVSLPIGDGLTLLIKK